MNPEQRAEAMRLAGRLMGRRVDALDLIESAGLLRTLAEKQAPAEPVYLHCGDGRAAFPVRTVEAWPEKNRAGYVHKLYASPPDLQAPSETSAITGSQATIGDVGVKEPENGPK